MVLYALAGIAYYVIGYNLMYNGVESFVGSLGIWSPSELASDETISIDTTKNI